MQTTMEKTSQRDLHFVLKIIMNFNEIKINIFYSYILF